MTSFSSKTACNQFDLERLWRNALTQFVHKAVVEASKHAVSTSDNQVLQHVALNVDVGAAHSFGHNARNALATNCGHSRAITSVFFHIACATTVCCCASHRGVRVLRRRRGGGPRISGSRSGGEVARTGSHRGSESRGLDLRIIRHWSVCRRGVRNLLVEA